MTTKRNNGVKSVFSSEGFMILLIGILSGFLSIGCLAVLLAHQKIDILLNTGEKKEQPVLYRDFTSPIKTINNLIDKHNTSRLLMNDLIDLRQELMSAPILITK